MLLILPLVRKGRRFFICVTAERRDIELKRKRKRDGGMAINRTKESRIMKKIFKDHGYESLLPSGEASQDINRKEIE